jgi:hypothetical protein
MFQVHIPVSGAIKLSSLNKIDLSSNSRSLHTSGTCEAYRNHENGDFDQGVPATSRDGDWSGPSYHEDARVA